ncbi:hypothetical protein KIW84_010841 [Lathyrus oleraceus]|uniref:Uncharacterized protein n=1 Tax=Pisum sativum TaxID=3888 RepID=A0A9D5BE16_PEA|nr:hypothetical protein KIW84_010841 [Pisum sativum]
MTLVLYNIRPRSHTSSIPLDTAYLLYYILDNRYVDVARIILNEIKMITESDHRMGSKIPCTLAFPGLCIIARISMPPVVHETIDGVVDDKYIEREIHVNHNLPSYEAFQQHANWPEGMPFHQEGLVDEDEEIEEEESGDEEYMSDED